MSWAAGVVRGGQVFLRPIFNKISSLQHASHRALISSEIHEDLLWWFNFLRTFNGRSVLLDKQPIECVFTDACNDVAGGSFGLDWFYLNWNQDLPVAESFHINEKEVLAVILATQRWASYWQNKHLIIYSDNSTTMASLNKGKSRNPVVMKCLRRLFWLSATYNFHMTSRHIAGIRNIAADSASRLHIPGYLEIFLPFTAYTPLHYHMSLWSLHFLLDRFPSWIGSPAECHTRVSS